MGRTINGPPGPGVFEQLVCMWLFRVSLLVLNEHMLSYKFTDITTELTYLCFKSLF